MAEHDSQPWKAEQRQLAVEKLRRAASLPRMKDGRRPPMHVEAVSEGEKPSPDIPDEKKPHSQSPPLEDISPPQEPANEPEPEPESADPEPDQDVLDRTISPSPAGRSKRRSRSRSRSRSSKDFKNKARNTQSPVPPAGDSSQDDEEPPVPIPAIAFAPPVLSPIPNHLSPLQSSHFLRSPTPDPSMFYNGLSPPTPIPLPTLEALQRGLFRSNSASSAAAGRRQALAKLTGGTDTYDPSPSTSPTPPPFSNGGLSRNNTVAGGERIAARRFMLDRLNGRLAKEAEAEASGSEERGAPSPTPKKRRRRSRGNSMRALNAGASDPDSGNTSADAPIPPHPFSTRPPDPFAELRAQSTTPMQTPSSQDQIIDFAAEVPPATIEGINSSPSGHARRRSILVEEEDEDEDEDENVGGGFDGEAEEQDEEEPHPQQLPVQFRYPGLPATPPRAAPHTVLAHGPHSSDPPSQGSAESVPLIYNQRTPSRNNIFPESPFITPLKERPSEEEEDREDRVLYYPNTFRPRTPFADIHTDGHGREISWIGDPVPIMIEDDSDEDDQDDEAKNAEDDDMPPPSTEEPGDEDGAFEEPLSPTSSEAPQKDELFSPQPSSQSVHTESERSQEIPAPSSSTPSSGALISTPQSIDEPRMSPQPFPARLSIRSRTPGGSEKSPLPGDEWDEQSTSTKRNGDHASPSTWDKLKGAFSRGSSGRRSRSNSLAARERRDNVDSSVSRESGASLTSARVDKVNEGSGQQQQQLQAPPVMQTPSASASILSLSPHTHAPPRGGASPIPPATTADLAKYQNAKLFPFPGIQKLEEQRNRVRTAGQASLSSPDVSTAIVDEDQPPPSAHSYHNTPAPTPEPPRERGLSHQASDSRLFAKPNGIARGIPSPSLLTPSNSQGEYIDVTASPASSHNGKVSKLPMTLPGVKQWLHNKKLFSSSSNPSPSQPSGSIATGNAGAESTGTERSKNGNKKPSLSDLLKKRGSDVTGDWEEVVPTPISLEGNFSFPSPSQPSTPATTVTMIPTKAVPSSSSSDFNEKMPLNEQPNKPMSHTDTEKTPKAKKLTSPDLQKPTYPYIDDSPSSLALSNLPSRSDPLLSSTPDPTSSLSDYPPRSTSQSSSDSSRYSVAPQGSVVIDRIENLVRGSKTPPFLASLIDDPPRKPVFTWPVYQVVNQKTVKDRFLFLFNDLLVVAKPKFSPHENLVEFKASSPDRLFTVKNVVLLKDIRFTPGRTDPAPRSPSQKDQQSVKSAAKKSFVTQFSIDPEGAVKALTMKHLVLEDPRRLGQFIFQTNELDRARIGEYLGKKTHKQELDAYLSCFGFVGVRVDKALRAFLMSVNVPVQNSLALDVLLDAFAERWYDANARFVAFDKNMASRLARALVRLNMMLHGDLAETPGPTGYPMQDFSLQDWIGSIRAVDPRQLLSPDLLEELYSSIRQEKLCQARCPSAGGPPTQLITIRKPVPLRLTYKSQSDPIILRIPAPDPHLTIHLDGQDLQFDPPVLTFIKSSEASFRIIGHELGLKTMIMCRSGPNALKYTGLPLSNTLVVERAFMRNTFQIAFIDHREMKRRYMFSVADPVWALHVRTSIEQASSSPSSTPSVPTEASKFLKVVEQVAFSVLQRTLIEGPESVRLSGLSARNGHASPVKSMNGKQNGFRHPKHVRSKSRSQLYRHDAGQNELDLSYDSSSYNEFRDSDLSDVNDEEGEEQLGPAWSGEDLVSLCQQNSTIPFVLSLLQVGVLGKEAVNSS
ncbi:hypothetical protein D9756_005363 [Leucocoprinus leucothites]|uniref:SEC7 domain-containing protein n=1 Tax=Leucocoprinus leucothites TaxID=201217 RepID=A0A8H5FZD7_9AGAR|nr:hypothetical protein D9756_005363 [Leucoagaricus leucothites]